MSSATARQWTDGQEDLLFEIVSKSELKPIGGESDGKMSKVRELWDTIHAEFMLQLPAVNAETFQATRTCTEPRTDFKWDALKRKFASWQKAYSAAKSKHISARAAQTGSASDGQPAEDAFIAAEKDFRLFRRFHEAFGSCVRLQANTTESMEIWQPPGTSLIQLNCSTRQSVAEHK
jgi:hypothetical protein